MTTNPFTQILDLLAPSPVCRHANPRPCNRCEAEMDALDPWCNDDMSEGDEQAAQNRADKALTDHWLGGAA